MYRENAWLQYSASQEKEVMKFAEGYKEFLSKSKTERLAVIEATARLLAAGFKNVDEVKSVKPGDKVFFVNKKKNVCAFIVGQKPLLEGLRILGAHIDSPRMDLKEHPIYEKNEFAFGDTHYYGGIKKYQSLRIQANGIATASRMLAIHLMQSKTAIRIFIVRYCIKNHPSLSPTLRNRHEEHRVN